MRILFFIVFVSTFIFEGYSITDSTNNQKDKPSWKFEKERLTFGGGVGGGISGGYTTVNVSPLIAYKFTDKFLAGPRLIYNYYSRLNFGQWSNFGYSVLGRYFVKENIFAHAEYEEVYYGSFGTNRLKIPALLIGAGYYNRPIALTATYDLLWNSNRSAYYSPLRVNFGIMF